MTQSDSDIHRTLLEHLSDGVMVIGFDGSVRMANAAAYRMFGLTPEETVGRSFGEIFLAFEGLDEFTQIVLDAVAERSDLTRSITRVQVGGKLRSLSITTSCLTESKVGQSEQVAVIAVISDITEVRELRETEVRQASVIKTQLDELQDAYRDLETRNEAISTMTRRGRIARGAAVVLVLGLFIGIGTVYLRPLDLFSAGAVLGVDQDPVSLDPAALPTITVMPREFNSTISLRGYLGPGSIAEVVSPIESHVSVVHAAPGDRVTEGDVVVELDTGQLTTEHWRAQIDQIKAEDRLTEIEEWETSDEMIRARRALRQARTDLDDAMEKLATETFLLEKGLISASQLETVQRDLERKTIALEDAERELETTKAKGGDDEKQVALLEVQTARDRVNSHQDKLDRAQIVVPITGVVLKPDGRDSKPLTKGRAVSQGELLLSVADMDRLSVATSINEVDIRKVEVGQAARISGPGFPGLNLHGHVSRVSARAALGGRQQSPSFEVVVSLDTMDRSERELIRVGMTAHVTIITYQNPDALLVPLSAVEQLNGQASLSVLDGAEGTIQKRPVRLGLTTLDSVEVLDGLAPGDRVVLFQ